MTNPLAPTLGTWESSCCMICFWKIARRIISLVSSSLPNAQRKSCFYPRQMKLSLLEARSLLFYLLCLWSLQYSTLSQIKWLCGLACWNPTLVILSQYLPECQSTHSWTCVNYMSVDLMASLHNTAHIIFIAFVI